MKTIVALLLGLSAICNAEDESVSFDSNEAATTQSYDGLVFTVRKRDGESPLVLLSTKLDDYDSVYCFDFDRVFESEDYPLATNTDAKYTEVDKSVVDLATANCNIDQTKVTDTNTQFNIICDAVNDGILTFSFSFISENAAKDGNSGLEYTVSLADYQWVSSSETARLVLEQSLTDCSSQYHYSADSKDDSQDDDGDNSSAESSTTSTTETPDNDETDRRRMTEEEDEEEEDAENDGVDQDNEVLDNGQDDESDSSEEVDGVSSDDSKELDIGYAQFIVDGQALDVCGGNSTDIESNLVYQENAKKAHIVFAHFECDLSLDPWVALDKKAIEHDKDDGAASMQIMLVVVIGLIAAISFF